MSRPLEEVQFRAGRISIVSDALREECIAIAKRDSPSGAFKNAVFAARKHGVDGIEAIGVAKATRWLAVIRRDHGDEIFKSIVRTLAQPTPTSRR